MSFNKSEAGGSFAAQMNLKHLTAFYLVAKHGRLLQAANHLGLSVPTISLQIKTLESELGVQLFQHRPNKLILTEPGRVFFKEIKGVFDALDRAKSAVSMDGESYTGRISISLGSDIAKFFAPQIATFIREHARLSITLLARPSTETLSLVTEGEVDLGVGRFERIPRGIHGQMLLEYGVCLVFPRNHPLSRLRKLRLNDLTAYRLIVLARGSATRKAIDNAFARSGSEMQSIVEVGNCQSACDLARLGLGVALVHDICLATLRDKNLQSVDLTEYFSKTHVSLIYRDASSLSVAHRALIKIFTDNAQKENILQSTSSSRPSIK